jgi:tRNA pseudouridine55 synthase
MHGALLVDKPSGPTSHDVVAVARRALKTPGIGHTGTLDPLATGLLVLLVGHATRLARFLVTDEKEYLADIRLGQATETYDAQSPEFRLKAETTRSQAEAETTRSQAGAEAVSEKGAEAVGGPERSPSLESRSFRLQAEDIDRVLAQFLGTFPQMPPPYSAKKVGGERAYKKARRNEPVELRPVEVTLHAADVVASDDPTLLRLRIVCSSGFYVRSLAHDIGQLLGCGAHLEALRRTRAGQFDLGDAITLDALQMAGPGAGDRLLELNSLLPGMPGVTLTDEGKRRALNGNTLAPGHLDGPVSAAAPGQNTRVLDAFGTLISVAEMRADGLLHPLLVLR